MAVKVKYIKSRITEALEASLDVIVKENGEEEILRIIAVVDGIEVIGYTIFYNDTDK